MATSSLCRGWALFSFCMMLSFLGGSAAIARSGAPPARGRIAQPAGTARVDPKAQVLLNQWKSALANLTSFSATVTEVLTSTSHGLGSKSVITHQTMAFQRPNLLKWVSVPDGDMEIVSDGTHLYNTPCQGSNLYATAAAPHNLTAVLRAADQADLDMGHLVGLVVRMFDSDDVIRSATNGDDLARVVESGALSGEPVDTLLTAASESQYAVKRYYSLGRLDHLPRRMLLIYPQGNGFLTSTITLSNVRINSNLDAKTFTFIPPADPVQPQAQALLLKMATAYGALKSFSETTQTKGSMGTYVSLDGRSTIMMKRPNLVSCTTITPREEFRTVCDGTHLYYFESSQKAPYQKLAAAPNFNTLDTLVEKLDGYLSFPLSLFAKSDPMEMASIRSKLRSVKVGAAGEVNGTAVDTIEAEYKTFSGIEGGTVRMAIGKKDHLLRKISIEMGDLHTTDTFSDVRVNPSIPPSAFHFTPPAGSKVAPAAP